MHGFNGVIELVADRCTGAAAGQSVAGQTPSKTHAPGTFQENAEIK